MNTSPPSLRAILIRQLDPAIKMLLSAIEICPDELWSRSDSHPPIWQHVVHAGYYLDKWMRTTEQPFDPPAFIDFAAVDLTAPPTPALEKTVLRAYVEQTAARARLLLTNAGNSTLITAVDEGSPYSLADLAIGQERHMAYHVGCISTILQRYTGETLPWIGYPK